MAKGSEQASWAWAKTRICAGCERKLTLREVACWHRQAGHEAIFCIACYPDRWGEWMQWIRQQSSTLNSPTSPKT